MGSENFINKSFKVFLCHELRKPLQNHSSFSKKKNLSTLENFAETFKNILHILDNFVNFPKFYEAF